MCTLIAEAAHITATHLSLLRLKGERRAVQEKHPERDDAPVGP